MKMAFWLLVGLLSLTAHCESRPYPYFDGKKWGLTNKKLRIMVPPQFDSRFEFTKDGYAIVEKDKKKGVIDGRGKVIFPCIYDKIVVLDDEKGMPIDMRERIFIIELDHKKGFINAATGKIVGKINYDDAGWFDYYDQIGKVRIGDKYGLINLHSGTLILPVKYDRVSSINLINNTPLITAGIAGADWYFDYHGKETKKNYQNMPPALPPMETAMAPEAPRDSTEEELGFFSSYVGKGVLFDWKIEVLNRFYKEYKDRKVLQTFEVSGYSDLREMIFPTTHYSASSRISAFKKEKVGIIDLCGNIIVPVIYDDIEGMSRTPPYYFATKLNNR